MKKAIVFALLSAACLCLLAGCGARDAALPETKEETSDAEYVPAQDEAEAAEAKSLFELTAQNGEKAEKLSSGDVKDLIKALDDGKKNVHFVYTGEGAFSFDGKYPDVSLTVECPAAFEFTGVLDRLTIAGGVTAAEIGGECSVLTVSSEGTVCNVSGAVGGTVIYGKESAVQFLGGAPGTILCANATARVVNSTDSSAVVTGSNGARYALPAHSTFFAADRSVAEHK